MELSNEQLQRLKECEKDMLSCFVEICNKHGIKYFLQGGTLLGAVRHAGFIPWDDDVDVSLMREDYDKFISVAERELPPYYFLQTKDTDKEYPNNFAKIRDSRTTFIETGGKNLKINHGAYIDIFPLDYYPAGINRKIFEIKKKLLTWRINTAFYLPNMSLKSKIATAISCLIYPSRRRAIEKREKLFRCVPKSEWLINNSGAWREKEIIPAEWFTKTVELNFEGIIATSSYKYDEWLTFVYGDYLTLPPKNERVGHHYTEIVDLDKSYTEYMNEVH